MAPLISSELRDSRRYHRHHSLHSPFDVADGSRCLGAADDAPIDAMLKAAIASTLIETGFDTADAVALDAFRNAVDECSYFLRITLIVLYEKLTFILISLL